MEEVKINESKIRRVGAFLKRNIFYVIAIILIASVATVIAVSSNKTEDIDLNEIPDVPVDVTPVTYANPLSTFTICKDYSDTELKYNSTLKQWESHKGVDLCAEMGAKVMSIADGKVEQVYSNYMHGTVIVISHDNGITSLYSSLATNTEVKVGDKVLKGEVIGYVSNTANGESSDGAHLHFEMTKNGVKVDPNQYLSLTDK